MEFKQIKQLRDTEKGAVVFVSRSSALKLAPLGVRFTPLADDDGNEAGGVFACPPKGKVTLAPGVEVDAEHVLQFLRGHRLCEAEPGEGGFAEVAT